MGGRIPHLPVAIFQMMPTEERLQKNHPGPTLTRRQVGLALGALLSLTALAYSGTLFAGFVWDDPKVVLPAVPQSPGTALRRTLTSSVTVDGMALGYFRPLVESSYILDGWLWGTRPFGFHLTNLILYLLCVGLAYLLARQILGEGMAAVSSATVFAMHPVHVESVAWVQGRVDLLAFAAAAAALLAFARALKERPSWRVLAVTGIAFLAALLSKEVALVVPGLAVICWALAHGWRRGPARRAVRAFAPFILILGVYAVLRAVAAGGGPPPSPDRLDPHERLMLAPVLFAKYLRLLIWPHPLNAYYDMAAPASVWDPRFLLGIGLLVATLAATAWAKRRAPRIALALVWFLVSLAPVMQIVPIKGFTMAERYLFLPSFGFALASGLAGEAAWKRASNAWSRFTVQACAGAIAAAWLALIMARVPDWVEKVAFYRAMVRTAPDSAYPHLNLGQALANQGFVEEGIHYLERAVALEPGMADAQVRLGLAYWQHGDLPRAIPHLEIAARLSSQDPRIQRALAIALRVQGRTRDAVTVLHRWEALQPQSAEVARRLAEAYAALGELSRAEECAARTHALASHAPGKARGTP